MVNEVTVVKIEEDYAIEKSRAKEIEKVFAPMVKLLKGFEKEYSEVMTEAENGITRDVTAKANLLRLAIRKIRTGADKVHKEQKSEALRWGRAIDGVRNILKYAVEEKEQKLKDVEDYFDNIEKEKIAKLKIEREHILFSYGMTDEEIIGLKVEEMSEGGWEILRAGAQNNYKLRLEAEKKAEDDRIAQEKADAKEKERVQKENDKLKEEKAKLQKKADADKKIADAKAKKLKDKADSDKKKLKDKAEADKKIADAKLEKERKEKEEIAKKLKDKEDAEKAKQKAIEDAKKAQKIANKKAKRAPDKEKLLKFAKDLKAIEFPEVKSEEAIKIIDNTIDLMNKVAKYVTDNAEKL